MCILALLLIAACAARVVRAQSTPPQTIVAVVLRDSTLLYADSSLTRALATVRLGDAFEVTALADSADRVLAENAPSAWLRGRDVGHVALRPRDLGAAPPFSRRYHPYVLWYAARHYASTTPADVWPVPLDRRIARVLFTRLVTEFPADTLVPLQLAVPDVHVRFGATEGNLRLAEMDLEDGDTLSAVTHLRAILERYPQLAVVHHLDAQFLLMIGDLETRAPRALGSGARRRGVHTLFSVVAKHPQDMVQSVNRATVPAYLAAQTLVDLGRFPPDTVVAHAKVLAARDAPHAVRMIAWTARGRVAFMRRRYAEADSFARLAFVAEPGWNEAVGVGNTALLGDPRPAAILLYDVWLARGARPGALGTLRALVADTHLPSPLHALAASTLGKALDEGTGEVAAIDSLHIADPDGVWRARRESGGFGTRVRGDSSAAPLRAGDWDAAPLVRMLRPGDSLTVLYVDATWVRDGGAIGHKMKVRTARGEIGWLHDRHCTRLDWTPLDAASARRWAVGGDSAAAVADGARAPRRVGRIVVGTAAPNVAPSAVLAPAYAGLLASGLTFADPHAVSEGDQVALFDPRTGRPRWMSEIVTALQEPPSLTGGSSGGAVLVPVRGGTAILRSETGDSVSVISAETSPGPGSPPVAVATDSFVYTFRNDSLICNPIVSHESAWSRAVGSWLGAVPAVTTSSTRSALRLLAARGGANGQLRAFDLATGNAVWTSPAPDYCTRVALGDSVALALSLREMWAVGARDGRLLWSSTAPGTGTGFGRFSTDDPAFLPGRVVFISGQAVVGLDALTGREVWRTPLASLPASNPCMVWSEPAPILVAVAEAMGTVDLLDPTNGRVLTRLRLRSWSDTPIREDDFNTPRWFGVRLSGARNMLVVAADDGIVDIVAAGGAAGGATREAGER
jgi:outer membrane protein assembly factor BamB